MHSLGFTSGLEASKNPFLALSHNARNLGLGDFLHNENTT